MDLGFIFDGFGVNVEWAFDGFGEGSGEVKGKGREYGMCLFMVWDLFLILLGAMYDGFCIDCLHGFLIYF